MIQQWSSPPLPPMELPKPSKNSFPKMAPNHPKFSLLSSSSLSTFTPQPPLPTSHYHHHFILLPQPSSPKPPAIPLLMTTTFTTSSLSPSKSSPLIASPPSLAHAQYGDDRVNLHIFIDHFKDIDSTDNGSVKLDAKLNESCRILDFVDGFSWKFGEKIMHYWTGNVGLQEQWLEVWWPSSDDEFAFVVEDDLEISLLYYKFLRDLIVNYYYNSSNFNPSIYGASLQRRRFVPGFSATTECAFLEALATADFNISVSKRGNKLQLDSGTSLFLYRLVAIGASFCFQDLGKSSVCGMTHTRPRASSHSFRVTTGWYKKMGEKIWTPWFIKFIHSRGYSNLYTNFSQERAFSISHRDAGVNYGKTAGPDSYLLDEDFNLLEMHPLSKLKNWRLLYFGKDFFSTDGGNFVYIVAKVLEQKGVKIKGIDEMSFGVNINASNVNQTSFGDGKKMVFWSFEMGLDLIWKQLEELGMWIIDGGSSCRSSSMELERRQFENGIAICLELGILERRIGKKITLELPNMTIDELKHHQHH
ncbi:unnamed protein product [Camellia sinensis]